MRRRFVSCEGLIELVSVYSYKGYLITQEEKYSGCGHQFSLKASEKEKFEKRVNLFDEMAV